MKTMIDSVRNSAMSSNAMLTGGGHEDCDFSDVVLKYINSMLMDEDAEERKYIFQEPSALRAAEKSFYEAIGEKYPPLPENDLTTSVDQILHLSDAENDPTSFVNQLLDLPDETDAENCSNDNSFSSNSIGIVAEFGRNCEISENDYRCFSYDTTSQASLSSSNRGGTSNDGFVDSPVSTLRVPDMLNESESLLQIKRGFQEARKFIPKVNYTIIDLENDDSVLKGHKVEVKPVRVKVEENYGSEYLNNGLKGKKNRYNDSEYLEEERSSKQSAIYAEKTVRSEMFDLVLLCNGEKGESDLREALKNEVSKDAQRNDQVNRGPNGRKGRGRKKTGQKEMVDLRTLLTLCAQAVAANDHRTTHDLLKQIRQHSSPMGDGMQRIAHYFSNGLEARLAGSGTKIFASFLDREKHAAAILKAYHLFLAVCPFKKLSNFFSNKTIMNVAENATSLHIIDFGILYGFQWPCLIQRLSSSRGGKPLKLRITGIDFPQPGFRPAGRVEETGRRLKNYAETFNVPFEFNGIAVKWETIQIEDLKLKDDDVLVVNCLYRFRNLLDETVMVESPRNTVLNMIRKIKPEVFIHGVVNGAYSAPFFLTRFREALFHFSTVFDMLEANVPRDIEERMLLEKNIFGLEAINVIACEGAERVERPETYKQWQVRNTRAGFVQLPLNEEIMKMAKDRVKTCYHKEFLVAEDGKWMLQDGRDGLLMQFLLGGLLVELKMVEKRGIREQCLKAVSQYWNKMVKLALANPGLLIIYMTST